MSQSPRILVAGIGNIFLGDDAFGVEVAQQMLRQPPIAGVRLVDFGIRGMDLTYALLENYDAAILVDAVPRGELPGTLYLIDPDAHEHAAHPDNYLSGGGTSVPLSSTASHAPLNPQPSELLIDAHSMDPVKVLRLVAAMGGTLRHILIVGCEPTPFDPETDMEITMTPPVQAAVPEAIAMIHSLIEQLQHDLLAESTGDSNTLLKGADDHGSVISTV